MKHIDTLPYGDAIEMINNGLQHLAIEHDDLPGETLDCYFHPVSGNLWHAYFKKVELYNVLSPTVIADLERKFAPFSFYERKIHV